MRCYFRHRGHIISAEALPKIHDDTDAISKAEALFVDRLREGQTLSGFEVWDRERLVYQFTGIVDENGDLNGDATLHVSE